SIFGLIFFPKIYFQEKNEDSYLFSKIFSFKRKLKEINQSAFSGFKSDLLNAIILGEKKDLPETLKEKLNRSGLRHLTAISGMHVTILSFIVFSSLHFFGFSRKKSLFFSIFFIFLFVFFVGFSPSALRGGLMTAFYFAALFFGRLPYSYYSLFLAAFLMLLQNPLLLKFDLGFQLSFLATAGIISFSSFFKERIKIVPNFSFFPFKDILAMTLSAQIFTFPLQVFNFGYFSLTGLLANLLVVPFLPLLIFFAFLFFLSAFFFKVLSAPFYLPLFLFLEVLERTIVFFGNLPFAIFSFQINVFFLFLSYFFLLSFAFLLYRKRRLPYFLENNF
ncbi:MAG: ComEC/Rec2 family competence protein, partial [Minisyncoccales bacterium]